MSGRNPDGAPKRLSVPQHGTGACAARSSERNEANNAHSMMSDRIQNLVAGLGLTPRQAQLLAERLDSFAEEVIGDYLDAKLKNWIEQFEEAGERLADMPEVRPGRRVEFQHFLHEGTKRGKPH